MIDPEAIANALLERVQGVEPVEYATRYKLGIDQLPQYPACIVGLDSASVQPSHGLGAKWTFSFDVGFIAREDGSTEHPETVLHQWLVNLQDALLPDDGESVLTLGGLCEHAWISGAVDFMPPDPGNPWMACWVTVEVLAVG